MSQLTTIEKLSAFVNQLSGIDKRDYNDSQSYNAEVREITKDRNDYYELLSLFLSRYGDRANEVLSVQLSMARKGRLYLNYDFELEYTASQYFPTEYRKAANQVLVTLIWQSFKDEQVWNQENRLSLLYTDADAIREAISARVSRRVMKLYFN